MEVYQKLHQVQQDLKAPKNQYNSFSKFNYRSCEDILEALKGPLKNAEADVLISDEIVLVGERYYIKATALFVDTTSGETVSATAFAREEDSKKGMDASQLTGSTSSYARKYALNGLFLIDDAKDADSRYGDDKPEVTPPKTNGKSPTVNKAKSEWLRKITDAGKVLDDDKKRQIFSEHFSGKAVTDLSEKELESLHGFIKEAVIGA